MMTPCLTFLGRFRSRKDQQTDNGISRQATIVSEQFPSLLKEVISKPSSTRGILTTPANPSQNPPSIVVTEPRARHDHTSLHAPAAFHASPLHPASDIIRTSGETSVVSSTSIQSSSEVTQTSVQHNPEVLISQELLNEFVKIQKLMLTKCSSPTHVTEDDLQKDNYLSLRHLRGILTEVRLHELFKTFSWYRKDHLQQMYNDYLCVIATLIEIGWRGWARFGELFFAFRKENKKSQTVRRDDWSLPFGRPKLDEIFPHDRPLRIAFHEHQYKYKHFVLQQDFDYKGELYPRRLPFINKDPIRSYEKDGYESSRPVYRVEIDAYGIKLRTQRDIYKENLDPEPVAMKVFRSKAQFDKENNAQKTIKANFPNYDHIVISYTSFLYRNEYYILYPWADGDLQSLFYGTFSDFSKMAKDRFTPHFVIKQLRGLAQGLNDLHERYELHHYDLKLENIFVYDLEVGAETNANSQGVGRWKIGDFGLAKERIPQSTSSLVAPANNIAERSSGDAPRNPGAFQAPEMRRGGSVNHNTDIFSLGCIAAIGYVFMLGGPVRVLEFEDVRRRGYDSDQFFTTTEHKKYEIKPEILVWLKELQASRVTLDPEWRRKFINCIEDLLAIERDDRISAREAARRLDTLSGALKDRAQLWKYSAQDARRVEEMRSDPSLSLSQPSNSQDMDRARQGSLDGANIALSVPGFPPPHDVVQCPLYTRLSIMDNVLCAKVNSRWAAFAGSDRVIVHDLRKLIQTYQIWNKVRPPSTYVAKRLSLPVPVIFLRATMSQFVSVQLADSFVILVTAPAHNPDDRFLELRSLKWSEEKSEVVSDNITHINVHRDCIDILLSAQGAIAFVFRDHIEVSFPMSRLAQPNNTGAGKFRFDIREPDATFRGAAFSEDGSYLCTWYYSRIQNWRVWKIHTNEATVSRQHWRYASIANIEDSQNAFHHFESGMMVSAYHSETDIAYFYVLDEDKRIWLIAPGGNEMIEPSENYCMAGHLGAWLPGKSVFILGNTTTEATVLVDVASGMPGSNRRAQPQVVVVNDWDVWDLASDAGSDGFVKMTDQDGKDVFVISQLDGSLTMIPIA